MIQISPTNSPEVRLPPPDIQRPLFASRSTIEAQSAHDTILPLKLEKTESKCTLDKQQVKVEVEPDQTSPGKKFSSWADFLRPKLIGEGATGRVYRVFHCHTKEREGDGCKKAYTIYAVKEFNSLHSGRQIDEIRNESAILRELNHPGIVRLHSSFAEKKKLYLVLDYALNGDFSTFLAQKKLVNFNVKAFYIAQMVKIIEYLREKRIVHRDLKPANFLMNEHFHLMLADFGKASQEKEEDGKLDKKMQIKKINSVQLSETNYSMTNFFVGTEEYISPEGLASGRSSAPRYENDLWSLGVMIWQIFSSDNSTPFKGSSKEETFQRIRVCDISLLGEEVPEVAKNLISKLLVKVPEKRLGANDISELRQHPFFDGVVFDALFTTKSPLDPKHKRLSLQQKQELAYLPINRQRRAQLKQTQFLTAPSHNLTEETPKIDEMLESVHRPIASSDILFRCKVKLRKYLLLRSERELLILKDGRMATSTKNGIEITAMPSDTSYVTLNSLTLTVTTSEHKTFQFYFSNLTDATRWQNATNNF